LHTFFASQIPLQTVRPLIFKTINLDECANLKLRGTEKQQQQEVDKYLKDYVEELLVTELDGLLTGHPMQPTQPQIRVRVIYTNDSHTLLPGKFGNHFEGRVANHSEILMFKRAVRDRKTKDEDGGFSADAAAAANELVGASMEELLAGYFAKVEDKGQVRQLCLDSRFVLPGLPHVCNVFF
jgi:hypothetical protein